MSKKKIVIRPRTEEQEARLDQDMKDLARFLYWKRRYYEQEPDGQDLIDLLKSSGQ